MSGITLVLISEHRDHFGNEQLYAIAWLRFAQNISNVIKNSILKQLIHVIFAKMTWTSFLIQFETWKYNGNPKANLVQLQIVLKFRLRKISLSLESWGINTKVKSKIYAKLLYHNILSYLSLIYKVVKIEV